MAASFIVSDPVGLMVNSAVPPMCARQPILVEIVWAVSVYAPEYLPKGREDSRPGPAASQFDFEPLSLRAL